MKQSRPTPRVLTRLTTVAVTAITIAALPMTSAASSGHAAALPAGVKICGSFNGPHWSYQGAGGTHYVAYTRHGGSCAFALKWAPRLVNKHGRDAASPLSGAPSGWQCANSVVHFGICVQTFGGHPTPTSKAFAWFGSAKQS
jgi:hypothetical protein